MNLSFVLRNTLKTKKHRKALIQFINSLSQQGLELSNDRLQGVFLRHEVSVRTAQMAHQHNRLGPMVQAVLDGGKSSLNPEIQRAKSSANPSLHLSFCAYFWRHSTFCCQLKSFFFFNLTLIYLNNTKVIEVYFLLWIERILHKWNGLYLWLFVICLSFIGTLKSTLKGSKLNYQKELD